MIGVNSPRARDASHFRNWRSLPSLRGLPSRLLAASPRIRSRRRNSRRPMSRGARRPTRRPGPTPRRPGPPPPIRHICRTSAPARTYRRQASASSRSTKRPARRRMRRPGPTPGRPAPPRPIPAMYRVSAEARERLAALDEQARKEADEKAWADAEKAGTASAFTSYVQKFGSGAHVAEARKRAAALETQGRKEVPTIDIQKTCQLAAGAMVKLMGGTTTEQDINACLNSEQKARDQIVKDLATYASADKVQCMRTDVYLPSYVEWLTCLEMDRDVRKMQREDQFGSDPQTQPQVRAAITQGGTLSAGGL